jgi:hypothetical protein
MTQLHHENVCWAQQWVLSTMVCLVPYSLDKMGSCSPRLTKTQTIYHLIVLSLNGYIFLSLAVTQILG